MKKTILAITTASLLFGINTDYLMQLANSNPDNIEARIELGKYFYENNELDKAKKYFIEVIKKDRNNKTAIYYLKKIYKKEQLNKMFKEYYTKDYNKIVNLLFSTEKYDKLILFYKLIDDVNKLSDNSLIKIAKTYMIRKEYLKSLEVLSHIRNKYSLDYNILSAYNYYYLKNYQSAKKYFEYLYNKTQNPEYGYKLLYIYSILKDGEKFKKLYLYMKSKGINVSYYDKTYQYFLHNTFSYTQKAKQLLKQYKYEEAKQLLLKDNSIDAKILLADIYLQSNKSKKALELFYQAAIKGDAKQKYIAKKAIANIYLQKSQFQKAREILLSLLKEYPNDIYLKEDLQLANKNFDILINRYKNYLYEYPNSIYYNLRLAYIYKIKGDIDNAIFYYKRALKLSPNSADIYKNLGELYLKKGDKEKALYYLKIWTKINNTKEAKEYLNNILNQNNKTYETSQTLPPLIDKFLNAWKRAWESRDIDVYSLFYDPQYYSNRWKRRKASIFRRAGYIKVQIIDPQIIYHKNNIYKVKFFQIYKNNHHKDKGYKTLTLKCNNRFCQIIRERWRRGEYKKRNSVIKTASKKLNSIESYLEQSIDKFAPNVKKEEFNPTQILNQTETKPQKPLTQIPKQSSIQLKKDDININDILGNIKESSNNIKENVSEFIPFFRHSSNIEKLINKEELELLSIPEIKKAEKISVEFETKYSSDKDVDFFEYKLKGAYKGFELFFSQFNLKENNQNPANFYYGIGYKNLNYDVGILYDNATSKIGFKASMFSKNYEISFKRENGVYEKESAYSTLLTDNIFKVAIFKNIKNFNIKTYLKYESLSDNNTVLTPYFNFTFYKLKINQDLTSYFNINGKYIFNSHKTDKYYSEKKADKTFVGSTIYYKLPYKTKFKFDLNLGYSNHASKFIYEANAFIFHSYKDFKYYAGVKHEVLPILNNTISKNSLSAFIEKEF